MASEETPDALLAADDANTRREFLGLVADHQAAIANMVTMLTAREDFGHSRVHQAIAGMRRSVADFQLSAERVGQYADDNIGTR